MGDPKKFRKKYEGPRHPWQKGRIDREKVLMREYSLKNKQELWKMESVLRDAGNQAKRLTGMVGAQAEKERKQLLGRLSRYGFITSGAGMPDILELTTENILNRRLQTLLFKRGLARTMNQARQCIVHRHVIVGGKIVTAPSYFVPVSDENSIQFAERSPFVDQDHPERREPEIQEEEKKEGKERKKQENLKKDSEEKQKITETEKLESPENKKTDAQKEAQKEPEK